MFLFIHQTQVPDDPIAREKYLKHQRDRLLESKKKPPEDTPTALQPSTSKIKEGSNQLTSLDKQPDKEAGAGGEKHSEEGVAGKQSSAGARKSGPVGISRKTGVLCTAIASKLKQGTPL